VNARTLAKVASVAEAPARRPHVALRVVLVRVAAAALLIFAITRMFDVSDVLPIMRSADPGGALLILLLTLLSWSVAVVKWKALLPAVPLRAVTGFYFLGQLYSLILPGQLAGEAVKTARMAARGINLGEVSASVVVDRVTGLAGLGIVSGLGLWLAGHGAPMFRVLGWTIWGFTILTLAVLLAFRWPALKRRATRIIWLLRRRGGPMRKLAAVLHRFVRTWSGYADNTRLVAIMIIFAVAFQLANVAIVAAIATSLSIALPFSDAAWIVGVVTIVTLVPIAIGGVGLREAGFVGLLGMIGVPAAQALSVSLVCTLIVVLAAAAGLLVELRWLRKAGTARG
jgi:uncharacterized protein (TIRG00374 family)